MEHNRFTVENWPHSNAGATRSCGPRRASTSLSGIAFPEQFHARIEAAPFFFLATSSPDGRCDCSFKGGGPAWSRCWPRTAWRFPHFEARVKGNGAYMSLGNILLNPYVSMLFIDFSRRRPPARERAGIHP